MNEDARALGRHRQPVAPLQRTLGIFVATLPVLAHRSAGKIVVLGMALVSLLLIDQMQDRDVRQVVELGFELAFVVGQLIFLQLVESVAQPRFPSVDAAIDVGL